MDMNKREGYKLIEIADLLGVKWRTLKVYADMGIVHADVDPGGGRGTTRLFSRRNVFEFALCKRLIESGIAMKQVRSILAQLRENPGVVTAKLSVGVVVLIDCATIWNKIFGNTEYGLPGKLAQVVVIKPFLPDDKEAK